MIVTELYDGQGLGNQLWNYFVTRIIAHQNEYKHGVMSPQKFKGKDFLEIDLGEEVFGGEGPEGGPPNRLPKEIFHYYKEKINRHLNGIDISKEDKNLFLVKDNTKIDGNLQSFEYIKDKKPLILSWFGINKIFNIEEYNQENVCIIHIRGGDFSGSSALLGSEYYRNSMNKMIEFNKSMKFYIITDDSEYAGKLLPDVKIIGGSESGEKDPNMAKHHMGGPVGIDWYILYKCRNFIISASSFSFWPVWLNENVINVIAPMYWADHKRSDGYWSCGDSLIPDWGYLSREGNFYGYKECLELKEKFENKNNHLWP